MLLLRDAQRSDLQSLSALARVLDTVNLPDDPRALAGIIDRSVRSFAGRIRNPLERSYVFVAEDAAHRQGAGHLHGDRAARDARVALHLLPGERARALLRHAGPALPAHRALHRLPLRRAHRDRRPGGAPLPPWRAGEAGEAARLRPLPLHGRAPGALPRHRAGGAHAAAHARRAERLLGGVRPPLHRPRLPDRRQAEPREQGIHPAALPAGGRATRPSSRRACGARSGRWGRRPSRCAASSIGSASAT